MPSLRVTYPFSKEIVKRAISELREREWFEEIWMELDDAEREDTIAQLNAFLMRDYHV